MNEIFLYFADVLLVTMRDALILLLDKFFKIKLGCSLALAISVVARERRSRGGGRRQQRHLGKISASLVPYIDKDGQKNFLKATIFNVFVKKSSM